MHEVSLAFEIIEMSRAVAQQHQALQVKAVHIAVGQLAGVEVDALQFALNNMRMDDMFEGTVFHIHVVPAQGQCKHCNAIQHVERFGDVCKQCGNPLQLIEGTSLQLSSIEI